MGMAANPFGAHQAGRVFAGPKIEMACQREGGCADTPAAGWRRALGHPSHAALTEQFLVAPQYSLPFVRCFFISHKTVKVWPLQDPEPIERMTRQPAKWLAGFAASQ